MIPTDQLEVVYDGTIAHAQEICAWASALVPGRRPPIAMGSSKGFHPPWPDPYVLYVWLDYGVNMQTTPLGYDPCPKGHVIKFDPIEKTFTHQSLPATTRSSAMPIVECEPKYINDCLTALAESHDIEIIHACESGSRAWGFASTDSDYDVRFIYTQPIGNYLAIEKFEKSITEQFPDGVLDFHGWDIHKALGLLVKGNAAFMEWINSPIIYQQDAQFIQGLREVIPQVLQLDNCFAHYRSMAKTTYLECVRDMQHVSIKKYFYTLRPLFAAQWILKHRTFPPVAFSELLNDCHPEGSLENNIIRGLMSIKSSGREQDHTSQSPVLDHLIDKGLRDLAKVQYETTPPSTKAVNVLLRETILRRRVLV